MTLDRCAGCGGFVPTSAAACPHCRASRIKLVTTLAVSTAISFTLMACYGGPPPPEWSAQPSTPATTGDAGSAPAPK